MSARNKRPVLVHPLLSKMPTGMGMAAESIGRMLVPEVADNAPRLDRLFRWINDCAPGGLIRLVLRLVLAQVAVWILPGRRLIFSSHHAPLWRTGRHAVVVYDIIALKHPGQSRMQAWYYRRILPRVMASASRLVTISQYVRGDLARAFPALDAAAVEVIPSSSRRLEAVVRAGRPLEARRANGLLVFIGARYAHKNLGLALEALLGWSGAERCARPRLAITSCRRDLWPELERLERDGSVSVHEYASDGEIDNLLCSAAALLFLSCDEGQGLPPLEAMASGCPVVCSDIPVLRETCGDAAWYINPRDARSLRTLLDRLLSGELDREVEEKRNLGFVRVVQFQSAAILAKWKRFISQWS